MIHHHVRTAPALLLLALLLILPGSSRADRTVSDALRPPTADEIPLLHRTLEAEALLVLDIATDYARRHRGDYPATVDAMAQMLPATALDNLLDGDPALASEDIDVPQASVVYVPLREGARVIGCEILVVGWEDTRMAFVSDGDVWRTLRARPILARSHVTAAR